MNLRTIRIEGGPPPGHEIGTPTPAPVDAVIVPLTAPTPPTYLVKAGIRPLGGPSGSDDHL
jgi:hypothetical protein